MIAIQSDEEIYQRFLKYETYHKIAQDNHVPPECIRQIVVKQQQRIARSKDVLTKLTPGVKVEITEGYLKGERATVEVSPETGSHLQEIESGWTEVWIRYEKDGQSVGKAILTPVWQDIEQLRVIQ